VLLGKDISGPDYVLITELRAAYIREVEALAAAFDAIVMPERAVRRADRSPRPAQRGTISAGTSASCATPG